MSQHLREEKPPKIEKLPTDKARLELPSFLPLIRLFSPHKQTNTIWRPRLSHLYLSQKNPKIKYNPRWRQQCNIKAFYGRVELDQYGWTTMTTRAPAVQKEINAFSRSLAGGLKC